MWKLNHKESWVPKNWHFWTMDLKKTLGSPLDSKEIKPSILKEINHEYIGRTDAGCEELTHWKRPWCWERLKPGGEGDDRRQDGWMASLTQWTWVWASSRRWRRTGKPGMLQSMGLQRVSHNWATEQKQWQCVKHYIIPLKKNRWSVFIKFRNNKSQWLQDFHFKKWVRFNEKIGRRETYPDPEACVFSIDTV